MLNFAQLHSKPKTPKKRFPFLNPELAAEIVFVVTAYGIKELSMLWPQYSTRELKQLIREAKQW